MKKYIPNQIEPKWQEKWAQDEIYKFDPNSNKPKYYNLVELPYTSGDLHIGHWFCFTPPDIHARHKRMRGFNVFYPLGFDSFGLPAENAAIKRNLHPREWTLSNIETMQKQLYTMGNMIDWNHRVITCQPEYYKWNQWIFLKMFEKGIAYNGKAFTNWCPVDQTVLADEQVVNGKCDRCGSEVVQKNVQQWFLKITAYADRLLWDDGGNGVDWPKSVREGQNNWIGKSEGTLIEFCTINDKRLTISVYTTRPDTLFGATFIVISPEHSLLKDLTKPDKKQEVEEYVKQSGMKSELERKENKDKTGVFTGSYVQNPLNKEKIPVWVADYVLKNYGTGAIMAVPAHDTRDFEFATKFNIPIKTVIEPIKREKLINGKVYTGEGVMIDSGEFTGLSSSEAREKISDYIEKNHLGTRKVNYHLHDWSISRQRYWGTPVPMIHCPKCGVVPVPEDQLPVELPYDVDFKPQGKPPLATNEEWIKVKCPKCAGDAERDPQTLDGFFDNSWYFLRYLDPKYTYGPFDQKLAAKFMPIDIYFGGAEHTLGHTLYARFFTKFMRDLGLLDYEEFASRRVQHGVVLGPDGNRMSKSHGNVINPDDVVKEYGADTLRIYLSFMMPYIDVTGPWNPSAINGAYHFLERVWGLMEKVTGDRVQVTEDLRIMHKTIKKVERDIDGIKFNTAIASLMGWLNYLSRKDSVALEEYKTFLLLLAPFAPHITEELWEIINGQWTMDNGQLKNKKMSNVKSQMSIHSQSWPEFDNKYLEEAEFSLVIQINGKVRDTILIQKEIDGSKESVEKLALSSEKIKKFLDGQSVKKTVYVQGKLINFVVGS